MNAEWPTKVAFTRRFLMEQVREVLTGEKLIVPEEWDKYVDAARQTKKNVKTVVPEKALNAFTRAFSRFDLDAARHRGSAEQPEISAAHQAADSGTLVDHFERYNTRHFLIRIGDRVRRTMVVDDSRPPDLSFESKESFLQFYENDTCTNGGRREESVAGAWLKWPGRRTYYGSIVFAPPPLTCVERLPDGRLGDYNLWRGFQVQPDNKPNPEQRCARYLEHLRSVVSGGERPEVAEFLLDVLAAKVQKPGRLTGVAVALRSSKQGTGKNSAVEPFARLFSPRPVVVDKPGLVTGRFNAVLSGQLVVILDEAFWPGHKEFTGTLKSLVTNTQLMIERKGVDPIAEPNLTQLFVLTNADWVWPYELSDRRALVLDVRDNKVGDRDYWDAYYAEVTSQEGLSALLAYLQQREIKSDLRRVPRTEAAGKQFQLSASSLDRLVYTWLERGYIDPDSDEWPEWVTVEDLYAIYRYELHGDRHLKHYAHQAFTAEIQRLLPLGAKTRRRVVDWSVKQELVRRNGCLPAPEQMKFRQRRRYGHALPPLATCRAHLERITGITHSWPDAIQLPLEQAS